MVTILLALLAFAHSEDAGDQDLSVVLNARLGHSWLAHGKGIGISSVGLAASPQCRNCDVEVKGQDGQTRPISRFYSSRRDGQLHQGRSCARPASRLGI